MANTENIEAKLCAYIDGELDAQGCAEIEKHLAANPQHRGLIEELSKQRQMLRALPRERAPDEILETLQGQLERAGLLGDDASGEAEVAMRINRWPQIMAAAAIVFLAIGLVGIIYFMLPGQAGDDMYAVGTLPGDSSTEFRAATSGAAPEMEAPEMDAPSTGAGAVDAFTRSDLSEGRDDAAAVPAPSAAPVDAARVPVAMKGGEAAAAAAPSEVAAADENDVFALRPGKAPDASAAMGLSAEIKSVQERLFSADLTRQLQNSPAGLQSNSMVMLVCTADTVAANSQVTGYLVSNGIQWEPVADGPPPPLDQSVAQEMLLSKNAPARVESKSMTFRQATQSPDVSIEQTVTLPPPAPQQEQFGKTQDPSQPVLQAESATPNVLAQRAETPAATQPAQSELEVVQQPLAGPNVASIASNDARRQHMIIARNMTQKQAADLSDSLLKQSYVQRAAVYSNAAAEGNTGIATTQPLALAPEDKKAKQFATDVDALARSGGKEEPATQELETARRALADRARDVTTAPVAADAPTAQPFEAQQEQISAAEAVAPPAPPNGAITPATAPAEELGAAAPTATATAPTALDTLLAFDDQQRVDVVIVLQDDEPIDAAIAPEMQQAGPIALPATQPAEPATASVQAQQSPATHPTAIDASAP